MIVLYASAEAVARPYVQCKFISSLIVILRNATTCPGGVIRYRWLNNERYLLTDLLVLGLPDWAGAHFSHDDFHAPAIVNADLIFMVSGGFYVKH